MVGARTRVNRASRKACHCMSETINLRALERCGTTMSLLKMQAP
jgi:hypothetical protein